METDEKGILTENELDGYSAYDAAISQHRADIEAITAVVNLIPDDHHYHDDYVAYERCRSDILAALKAEVA